MVPGRCILFALFALAALVDGVALAGNGAALVTSNHVTVLKTLSRHDIELAATANYPIDCPEGMIATGRWVALHYPPNVMPSPEEKQFMPWHYTDKSDSTTKSGQFWEVSFVRPLIGTWSTATVITDCTRFPPPSAEPEDVLTEVRPVGGADLVFGYAECPAGKSVAGGLAWFPAGDGVVLAQTADAGLADPFSLPADGVAATVWVGFGRCTKSSCRMTLAAQCAAGSHGTVRTGKAAGPAFRSSADAPASSAPSILAVSPSTAKSMVAPGARAAVAVTCAAGSVAANGGFIASDPTAVALVSLTPTAAGVPYADRVDGTYEAPTGWTAVADNLGTSPVQIGATAVCVKATTGGAPANYQGLWWADPAGSESGWGISFAHQGDIVFATWFTYDADGKPWWLGAELHRTGEGIYSGDVFTVTGPAFDAVPWDPALVRATTVGTMTATFRDAGAGTLATTVNGRSQTKAIVRQALAATPMPVCVWGAQSNLALATNYQDLWWAAPAGSESGWGLSLAHQGDTVFAVWFTYGADGKPWWLVAVAQKTGPAVYEGQAWTVRGPPFGSSPWDTAKVVETPVGTIRLSFADGRSGTFASTVNGVLQTKSIVRQVFVEPGTSCQ